MRKKFKEVFGKTDDILREYPMVLLMAFLAAVAFICYYDHESGKNSADFVYMKFGMVACLGISLMFGLKMLAQRIGKGIFLEIAGTLFLIFFYLLLPEKEKDFTVVYAFLILPTFILSHLLVSFVAFFGEKRELRFWQYNKNLFINIFLTAVFTGVLTGGVELAILAVDKLFDFNFNDSYYVKTFYFLTIFGSALIFLLFNEKGLRDLEKDSDYPQILKFFTQYILIPLLLIYAVILYFYSAKILMNWELPRGWVSYLVLAYAVVGILGLLLVHPLKEDSTRSWVRIFSKIFYFTLIPLIVLLFTAIFTRILQYGYTEPRYFVLLLALWLTSVVLYFVFFRKTSIKFIPLSLFAFGLFALIFPYLNTFSVAKRSQKNELQNVLSKNNLLENGKINFNQKVSDTVTDAVADKFKFLAERKQNEFLMNLLAKSDQQIVLKNSIKGEFWNVSREVREHFTSVEKTKTLREGNMLELVSQSQFHHLEGYDFMIDLNGLWEESQVLPGKEKLEISAKQGVENILEITVNKETWNLSPFLKGTLKKYENQKGKISVPEISAENDMSGYHLKVVFDKLVLENVNGSGIYFTGSYLLIRKKE